MAIEIVRASGEDAGALAQICYEAFSTLQRRHHVPLDIPSVEVAAMGMGMFLSRPDFYGVVAKEGGKIVGHNFLQLSDAVAGVGPICVDNQCQSRGVGRELMQHVVEWALKNHGPMVRLLQEGINMTSLSLYASLGFEVREPIVKMTIVPAGAAAGDVRALTMEDLPVCEALCKRIYKVGRTNELAAMIQHGAAAGVVPQGRFAGGALVAYVIPGFFGYGVGETAEDLLETAQQAARVSAPPLHVMLVPMRETAFFRGALERGWRSEKMFNLMSMGPYESPTGAWAPSIGY